MVLLAAAICTKAGKALVSRQFVEMTRARIEGLLASFPKLIGSGKQHTFIETESVRYVYQPLEKLYMLLITTKASNILEDLETLRLFSRVIPEYCKSIEEKEIHEHAFDLLFAFDEIVALGYRENVNLAQIRTFTDMESHEEKVFKAMRETQEREAKEKMRERAKEIQRLKLENKKLPGRSDVDFRGGIGSSNMSSSQSSLSSQSRIGSGVGLSSPSYESTKPDTIQPPSLSSNRPNRAMKLGGNKEQPAFIEQSVKQTLPLSNNNNTSNIQSQSNNTSDQHYEKVHLRVDEKITLTCGKDGGLQNMEVHGILFLRVATENDGKVKVKVENNDKRNIQLQTHPNVDKKLYSSNSMIALKDLSKSFPAGQDVGVLKWRFQTQDESEIPLTINCWPSETPNGCDVNIEYELQKTDLELDNVTITIPIPSSVAAPIIKQCDGDYTYEKYKNHLLWRITTIDESNSTGSLEFSVSGHPADFFPVNVNFSSRKTSYCDIKAIDAISVDTSSSVKYSSESILAVEKYEIV